MTAFPGRLPARVAILVGAAVIVAAPLTAARASIPAGHAAAPGPASPYSPAYRHPYRRGVVPTRAAAAAIRRWQATGQAATAASSGGLSYHGGIAGVGVTTGHEKVYLVFWGAQWGAPTVARGVTSLAGDPSAEAPYLQRLFSGLGTDGETWSGVLTQYCQGVPPGSVSCPASNAQHVAYPSGGALAGVWADESARAPGQASGHQIALEAIAAAKHFGNTTAPDNRDAQYIIASPSGTHPDGFNTAGGTFCAWHDWTGDPTLSGGPARSSYGGIAFTNLPYVTDLGSQCGQNFVNHGAAGRLDGVSIIAGHEYAETVTDQNPAGGWTTGTGLEDADVCAWNSGRGAHAADLALATGTFAMQPTWANDAPGGGGCEMRHAIVRNGSGSGGKHTVTVRNPGRQWTGRLGRVRLAVHATDSARGARLRYAASGLPAGLRIDRATGVITGRATRFGDYLVTVTAADRDGATGSASFTWDVTWRAGSGHFPAPCGSAAVAVPAGNQRTWVINPANWLACAHAQIPRHHR